MQEGKNSREESDKERNNECFDSMGATAYSVCVCVYNLRFCKQKTFSCIYSGLNSWVLSSLLLALTHPLEPAFLI